MSAATIDLDALEQAVNDGLKANSKSLVMPNGLINLDVLAALIRAVRAALAWHATEPESVKYPSMFDEQELIALEDALAPFKTVNREAG